MTEDRDVDNYNRLVARVAAIDPDAADYMLNEAFKLSGFNYAQSLWRCFIWEDTPQGFKFWCSIAHQLDSRIL